MITRLMVAVVILAVSLVRGTLGVEPAVQAPVPIPASQDPRHAPAIIRDGQVYCEGKNITSTPETKQWPVRSQDGKKVAFYALNPKGGQVGIVKLNNQEIIYADLSRVIHTDVFSLYWLAKDRIGFYAHLNPNTEVHVIIDAETGDLLQTDYGVGFTWSEDGEQLYYAQLSPHFSPWETKGRERVMRDGDVMYETADLVLLSPALGISADDKLFAFYEYDNQERWYRLVIAENEDGNLSVAKRIAWFLPLYNMTVEDDNTLILKSGSEQLVYNWLEERMVDSLAIRRERPSRRAPVSP